MAATPAGRFKPSAGARTRAETPAQVIELPYVIPAADKRFIGLHVLVALIALSIGSLFGPLQSFEFAGLDIYPLLAPLFKSYYQGLTLHGVLNALVFTTFFITGFFSLTVPFGLRAAAQPAQAELGGLHHDGRRPGGHGDPDPAERSLGALHLLPADASELALLPGADAGCRGELDRGLWLLHHLLPVAQAESGRAHPLHRLRQPGDDGHVADRDAGRGH